jgi:hypothetical protein
MAPAIRADQPQKGGVAPKWRVLLGIVLAVALLAAARFFHVQDPYGQRSLAHGIIVQFV